MDIQFLFTLLPYQMQNSSYDVGFIEGEFKILLDGRVFFDDPHLNVAELGVQLGKWLKKVNKGRRDDFHFETIDHDEAILDFFYKGEEQWQISSIWENFTVNETIHIERLLQAVLDYLSSLNQELKEINYVLKLDKYLK